MSNQPTNIINQPRGEIWKSHWQNDGKQINIKTFQNPPLLKFLTNSRSHSLDLSRISFLFRKRLITKIKFSLYNVNKSFFVALINPRNVAEKVNCIITTYYLSSHRKIKSNKKTSSIVLVSLFVEIHNLSNE